MKKILIIFFILISLVSLYSQSENDLLQLIETNPSNYKHYKNLGIYYFEKDDYYNAIEFLNNAYDLNIDDIDLYNYLAKSYLKINKPADAEYILKHGLKYFPRLKNLYNEGLNYTFTIWIKSNYYHNRYKTDVKLLAENELAATKLFDFQRLRHHYLNLKSVEKFNDNLNNFYFYRDLSLSEIIGHSILTDIFISYNINNINFDLLNALKNYLIENTQVVSVMWDKYYGYREPRRIREQYSEHSYREYFSPLTVKVRVPFTDEIFVNHNFDNAIDFISKGKKRFNDVIDYMRDVYDKVSQQEYKEKFESFILFYVNESLKNIRQEYLYEYVNKFSNVFPEQKFKNFINTLQVSKKPVEDLLLIDNIYNFISVPQNFEYLNLNNIKLNSEHLDEFINNKFILSSELNKFYINFNFKNEEYFIYLPEFDLQNYNLDLLSDYEPLSFFRSISKYYRERNEIIDWRLYIVYNITGINSKPDNKFEITLDIFYAKLYNSKFDFIIHEWFNVDKLNIKDYSTERSEIKKYLFYIE